MKQHCPSCGKKFDYEQHGWICPFCGQVILGSTEQAAHQQESATPPPCEKAITQAEKIVGTFHGWIAADGELFRVSDWKKFDLPATEADF